MFGLLQRDIDNIIICTSKLKEINEVYPLPYFFDVLDYEDTDGKELL